MTIYEEFKDREFYPTPEELARTMARAAKGCKTFLEPSAGDGALIKALRKEMRWDNFSVDYIEISQTLRTALSTTFSDAEARRCSDKANEYRNKSHNAQTYEEQSKYGILIDEYSSKERIARTNATLIWDDFETFSTYKKYDCIIMNPPFSCADKHIIKAIRMQEKWGGSVIALCNAETIRNPYTLVRQELLKLIEKYSGKIEYHEGSFEVNDAGRKSSVEVALITLKVPEVCKETGLFEDLKSSVHKETIHTMNAVLSSDNKLRQLIELFNNEIAMGIKLIKLYKEAEPMFLQSFKEDQYNKPLISLNIGNEYDDTQLNTYIEKTRLKYWAHFFKNPQFTSMLTSNLRDEFRSQIQNMKAFDFNEFNLQQVLKKMSHKLQSAYDDTIITTFDTLSNVYSYRDADDCENIHYYNGWKTNKAWKINDKKVIVPFYGMGYFDRFDTGKAYSFLSDIEKTLNYIDNGETPPYINDALSENITANRGLSYKYFTVTFYKKGTCHIVWKDKKIVEKLNIIGSQKKGWLPPTYGRKKYEDFTDEEKAVVDDFQGEIAYRNVFANRESYLGSYTKSLLLA